MQKNLNSIWMSRDKSYAFSELCELTGEMLEEYTGQNVSDIALEENLRKNQEEHRRIVSGCIRTCCSGNFGARDTVKEIIREYLIHSLKLSERMLEKLIPFQNPEQMSGWQLSETLIYYMDKQGADRGFGVLCEKYGWGIRQNLIETKQVYETYMDVDPKLSYMDRINILTQLVFAKVAGLGVIDTLNQQKGYVEEIQLGMNGRSEQGYDYKEEMSGQRRKNTMSRDGVHILVRGKTIWLSYLSFGTEEELQRVLRNLIKESSAGELTKNHPMIVVDTVDGRRISVSRPPMTDAWVGLIRKFDTVSEVSLEKLYRGYPEEGILPELLRQLVRSGRNIAITGEMASGKTTLFRACLAETREDRNIRVIEADSFEMNVREFMPRANSMTMRISEKTPAEEVLAFARKTTGQIFAVGEINSLAVAAMAMDLSKISSQLMFSAHYVTTEHMVADFVNAKLCIGGYSEEILAQQDVIRCLGFDVHLINRRGKRYVQYINEISPKKQGYEIQRIYEFDEEKGQGVLCNPPGNITFERARQELDQEEYRGFCDFFAKWAGVSK